MRFTDHYLVEAQNQKKHNAVSLPKSKDFSPTLSSDAVALHVKFTEGYEERANDSDITGKSHTFNVNGLELHNIWWSNLQGKSNNNNPVGDIKKKIESKYNTFTNFKNQWEDAALSIQGNGWVVLLKTGKIMTIRNHDILDNIVMVLDMWEHAWIMDYPHDKAKYVESVWDLYDWKAINDRFNQL